MAWHKHHLWFWEAEHISQASELFVKVQAAITANGRGLFWDLSVVERKLHPLFREWDASHPSRVFQ